MIAFGMYMTATSLLFLVLTMLVNIIDYALIVADLESFLGIYICVGSPPHEPEITVPAVDEVAFGSLRFCLT